MHTNIVIIVVVTTTATIMRYSCRYSYGGRHGRPKPASLYSAAIAECSTHSLSRLRTFTLGWLCSSLGKEREQVLAHSELFVGSAWYPTVTPRQWCNAVGVRNEDSAGYLETVATNLAAKKNPSAFTLAAINKSSSEIAGYIFCTGDCPETLMVEHLKVDDEYQGRGVGTMLGFRLHVSSGATRLHARAAELGQCCWMLAQRGWRCKEAMLAVLAENGPARRLYEKTGFKQLSSSFMELAQGMPDALCQLHKRARQLLEPSFLIQPSGWPIFGEHRKHSFFATPSSLRQHPATLSQLRGPGMKSSGSR